MATLPSGTTVEDFYNDPTLQGGYQYVSIKDIVNNFQISVVGDRNHIKYVERDVIIFHAKRGLSELTYDVLKEIKGIEIELSDTLGLILPEDYVKYVRVSWIDDAGNFRPMVKNSDTLIAKSYLQDNNLNIIFDTNGDVITATQNTYDETLRTTQNYSSYNISSEDCAVGARFGMDTAKANANGWFTIDKRTGIMKFSSNIGSKIIVLEYISDGLEYASLDDIKVHKFAEDALMKSIEARIIEKLDKIPEYVVKRKVKAAHIAGLKAKNRLSGLNYEELLQILRGKGKRLK